MSLHGTLTVDATRFTRALQSFARWSRKDAADILRDQARSFVRKVVSITPPSRGKANVEAKRRGEAAVKGDLKGIFDPIDPHQWRLFFDQEGKLKMVPTAHDNRRGAAVTDYTYFLRRGEMKGFHEALRTRANGGVTRVNRGNLIGRKKSDLSHIGFVRQADFNWYLREKQRTVGWLAAGWNKSAETLGYKPPAWIGRHRGGHGTCLVDLAGDQLRIIITNDVSYVTEVQGLQRQVQTALDWQGRDMERRVAYFIAKRGRGAGFR